MSEDPNPANISSDLRQLLHDRVETFEQLESLLLIRKQGERHWSPDDIAEHLAISVPEAKEALEHLRRNGLLNERGEGSVVSYRMSSDPEVLGVVDQLVQSYEDSRVEILRLMSANTIERLRNQALRAFADAFILRRKKDG